MKRLLLPLGLLAVLAYFAWHLGSRAPDDDRPWNLVLISIDTLRADHVSAYGYERATTPEIDALARRGVVFERAYSQSPKTAPSHMSILTGLLPEAHGVRNFSDRGENRGLSANIPTLAALLADEGYRTAAFTGGGHVRADLGFDRGFDTFAPPGDAKAVFEGASAAARRFSGHPFFLFVHTYEIHDPYAPSPKIAARWTDPDYAGSILSTRDDLEAAAGTDWGSQHKIYWDRVDPDSPADIRQLQALYDGALTYTDSRLGAFIDRLEALGELDRTLIVFLSDHGEEFHEHGGFQHETVYQETLHVPLVIVPPTKAKAAATSTEAPPPQPGSATFEGRRGTRSDSLVRLVDVFPTVLELLGFAVPEGIDGASLSGHIRGDTGDAAAVLSTWPRDGMCAWRKGRWKFIWMPDKPWRDGSTQLYDVVADPGETNNLATVEVDVARELQAEMFAATLESRRKLERLAPGRAVEMSPELRSNLRALGYLGDK